MEDGKNVPPLSDEDIAAYVGSSSLRQSPYGYAFNNLTVARLLATITDLKRRLSTAEQDVSYWCEHTVKADEQCVTAEQENKSLRDALDEMEKMYTHCWDLVDSGDKLMMASSVERFDEACRRARIALGRPLYGDNGEWEAEEAEEAAALKPVTG